MPRDYAFVLGHIEGLATAEQAPAEEVIFLAALEKASLEGRAAYVADACGDNAEPISVGASVVWSRGNQAAQGLRYGLQFVDIGESEQSILTEYVQRRLTAG